MRDQSTVVDNGRACSNEAMPTARLTFRADAAGPSRGPWPTDAGPRPAVAATTVILTLADDCREAVSSDGGRVRLSGATVDQLKHLFGIRA